MPEDARRIDATSYCSTSDISMMVSSAEKGAVIVVRQGVLEYFERCRRAQSRRDLTLEVYLGRERIVMSERFNRSEVPMVIDMTAPNGTIVARQEDLLALRRSRGLMGRTDVRLEVLAA